MNLQRADMIIKPEQESHIEEEKCLWIFES